VTLADRLADRLASTIIVASIADYIRRLRRSVTEPVSALGKSSAVHHADRIHPDHDNRWSMRARKRRACKASWSLLAVSLARELDWLSNDGGPGLRDRRSPPRYWRSV